MGRRRSKERGQRGVKKIYINKYDALCHSCKDNRSDSLHSRWLPFWNMQTTSRLYSAELQQQLTPHHRASQTGSLLSEPLWGRKKNYIKHQTLCLHKQHERQTLTPWIGGRPGQGLAVCQRNQSTSSLALNSRKTWSRITEWRTDCWGQSSLSFDEIALSLAAMTHMW